MGEAILAKAVGFKPHDPLDDVPVISTACSLLVTVKDSYGGVVKNTCINCKDGSAWYNYHTNEKGMVVFQCTSGAANIIALNYSVADSFNIVDQLNSNVYNIDAPIATKNAITINLNPVEVDKFEFTSNLSNIKFQSNKVYVQMVGGGAGGNDMTAHNYSQTVNGTVWTCNTIKGGNGGGGGAYNESIIQIDHTMKYNIIVGSGGRAGYSSCYIANSNYSATAGGTSSAFGLSAVGGSGWVGGGYGNFKGGDGGYYEECVPDSNFYYLPDSSHANGTDSSYKNKINMGGGGGAAMSKAGNGVSSLNKTTDINNIYGGAGGGNGATLSWFAMGVYTLNQVATNPSTYGSGGGGGCSENSFDKNNTIVSASNGMSGVVIVSINNKSGVVE